MNLRTRLAKLEPSQRHGEQITLITVRVADSDETGEPVSVTRSKAGIPRGRIDSATVLGGHGKANLMLACGADETEDHFVERIQQAHKSLYGHFLDRGN